MAWTSSAQAGLVGVGAGTEEHAHVLDLVVIDCARERRRVLVARVVLEEQGKARGLGCLGRV